MTRLEESTQLIHVSSTTELSKPVIQYALNSAMATRRYAKFYSDKYYIIVTFQRDMTVTISSNYRWNVTFDKELTRFERNMNTTSTKITQLTYFIWYWMNKIRKQ